MTSPTLHEVEHSASSRAARTRQEILTAAATEVRIRGLDSARLEKILARANVTKGALYHHFGSRHGLLHAVIQELLAEPLLKRWEEIVQNEDPWFALIELLSNDPIDFDRGEFSRSVTVTGLIASCNDPKNRDLLEQLLHDWRGLLKRVFSAGRQPGASKAPQLRANLFLATYEGIADLARASRDRQLYADLIAQLRNQIQKSSRTAEGSRPNAVSKPADRTARRSDTEILFF